MSKHDASSSPLSTPPGKKPKSGESGGVSGGSSGASGGKAGSVLMMHVQSGEGQALGEMFRSGPAVKILAILTGTTQDGKPVALIASGDANIAKMVKAVLDLHITSGTPIRVTNVKGSHALGRVPRGMEESVRAKWAPDYFVFDGGCEVQVEHFSTAAASPQVSGGSLPSLTGVPQAGGAAGRGCRKQGALLA